MRYKELNTNFTVLFDKNVSKPLDKKGNPAKKPRDIKYYRDGYKVKGQASSKTKKNLDSLNYVELNKIEAIKPDDFNSSTEKLEEFWHVDLDDLKFIAGVRAVPLTNEELEKNTVARNQRKKRDEADQFLSNLDLDNMTKKQLENAVKALIIAGGYQR